MADSHLLNVDWYFDASAEDPLYELRCTDPDFEELKVSIPASSVTERAARAKLIEAAFQKARDMGLDETRLRFHV